MKNMNKHLILILLASLLFGAVLTACGGEDPTPTPRPTRDNEDEDDEEPEPTAIPTEEPTPLPEPTETPDPTAGFIDFSNDALGVSFSYPGDWAIEFDEEGDELKVASGQDILDDQANDIKGAIMNMFFLDRELLSLIGGEELDAEDPVAVLALFADLFTEQGEDGEDITLTVTEEPTAVTINGQEGAQLLVNASDAEGDTAVMTFYLIMSDTRAVIVLSGSEVSEEAQNRPILDTIVNTITLSTPVGVATETVDINLSGDLLLYGDTVSGAVDASGPSAWGFIGGEGELVDIIVVPEADFDVVVDVLDDSGASILPDGEVDNEFGTEQLLGVAIPATGNYIIAVRGFADATGSYQLTIAEAGTAVTPTDSGGEGELIAYGAEVSGAVDSANPVAAYSFSGFEDDDVGLVVTPLGDFDAVVDIANSAGNSLLSGERDASFGRENVLVTLPADDVYTIYVRGFGDAPGSFDMHLGLLTNVVIAVEDTLEADDVGVGHSFPFSTLNANSLVGIIVEPADELNVAIQVRQGDAALQGMGFDGESGFDASFGVEEFVALVEEASDYMFQVLNSQDEAAGTTGDYAVLLFGTPDVVFELAYGDFVDARTDNNGEIGYFINGSIGDSMVINVVSDDDSVDMVIEVLDLDGNVLASIDDGFSGEPEELVYTFENDGLVLINVRDFYGGEGGFVMSVQAQ